MNTINLKKVSFIGWGLMMFSLAFALAETIYFGSNFLPESKAELTCDFLAIFVCGVGGALLSLGIILKTKDDIQAILRLTKKKCSSKIDGQCPLHNLHCTYPDCEK